MKSAKEIFSLGSKSIIQSKNDKLVYKAFKLKNQMNCVVISDSETHDSAAVMNVRCGSFEDASVGSVTPGLAHLLEHLLFMGSKRFPNMGEYRAHITENGGESNAYTDLGETVYYFNCVNESFKKSVDMFSDFFSQTLLLEEAIISEVNAVHSEHEKNLNNENWKEFQLMRELSQSDSPYHGFSTGNKETLGSDDIYKKLRTFYENKYSANIMNLVLYGQDAIDDLEKMAIEFFSQVPNKDLKKNSYNNKEIKKSFGKNQLNQIVRIQTASKVMRMKLTWQFDYELELYKSNPYNILSHIIGHESEGSLLSALKSQALAYSLTTSCSDIVDMQTNFEITMSLTEKGWKEIELVLHFIGSYIRMVLGSNKDSLYAMFTEVKEMNRIKFDFQEKSAALNKSLAVASVLDKYEVEHLLIGGYLQENFDYDKCISILQHLDLENSMILLSNDEFDGELKEVEPIYKTKYDRNLIPKNYHDSWNRELQSSEKHYYPIKMPPENIFIPLNFDLHPLKDEITTDSVVHPKIIFKDALGKLYYKQDNLFRIPKIIYNLNIYLSLGTGDEYGRNRTFLMLWVTVLKEYLNEFNYLAQMAGLNIYLTPGRKVFGLQIIGYSDSFKQFLPEFGKRLRKFVNMGHIEDEKLYLEREFENQKSKVLISGNKKLKREPYKFIYDALEGIFVDNLESEPDSLEIVKNADFKSYLKFHHLIFERVYTEAFFNGNLTEDEAKIMNSSLLNNFLNYDVKQLFLTPDLLVRQNIIKLDPKNPKILLLGVQNPNEKNSATLLIFQTSEERKQKFETRFLTHLASNLISSVFFEELRTKLKLGYVVQSFVDEKKEIYQMAFLVQGTKALPNEVAGNINQFLFDYKNKFTTAMTNEEFSNVKAALITGYKKKFKTLNGESTYYFDLVFRKRDDFDYKNTSIKAIEKITQSDLIEFIEEIFYKEKRFIEIHLSSQSVKEENQKNILTKRLTGDAGNDNALIFYNERSLKQTSDFYKDETVSKVLI